ncbi:hypothetical protein AB838_02250 [Rhodobacteraceae bacterium (ex Bugula neritina AB1)]|nr:hypothetical protein AB838_02250 [Rhodobacteraceae bacterium (ex Bugula neritina AB1)]
MLHRAGRGLKQLLCAVGITVALIAIAHRAASDAPKETGELQAMGIIGVAWPAVLQPASRSGEEEASVRGGMKGESSPTWRIWRRKSHSGNFLARFREDFAQN